MILLASDLDNTMIYSYKRQLKNRVPVEEKDERVLSYMTAYAYGRLQELPEEICFAPVTTRSLEQYRRIRFPGGREPEYALVSNGGILLRRGEPDSEWYEESKRLAGLAEPEFTKAASLLKRDPGLSFEIRMVDELFLFTKSSSPEDTVAELSGALDLLKVEVFFNGIKIYVVPRSLNKGRMLRRLREILGFPYTVGCGDSLFDIPLLLEADLSIYPQALTADVEKGRETYRKRTGGIWESRTVPEGAILSDAVFHCLDEMKMAGV